MWLSIIYYKSYQRARNIVRQKRNKLRNASQMGWQRCSRQKFLKLESKFLYNLMTFKKLCHIDAFKQDLVWWIFNDVFITKQVKVWKSIGQFLIKVHHYTIFWYLRPLIHVSMTNSIPPCQFLPSSRQNFKTTRQWFIKTHHCVCSNWTFIT